MRPKTHHLRRSVAALGVSALLGAAGGAPFPAIAQDGHSTIVEEDLDAHDPGLAPKPEPTPDADWESAGREPLPSVEPAEHHPEPGGAAGKVERSMGEAGEKTRGGIEHAGEATGKALDRAIDKTGKSVGYVIDKTGDGLRKAGEALSGEGK